MSLKLKVTMLLVIISLHLEMLQGQDDVVQRNKIDIHLQSFVISPSPNILRYQYQLTSLNTSEQNVWKLWIISPDSISISNQTKPEGWYKPEYQADSIGTQIYWSTHDSLYDIQPGQSNNDFSFETAGLIPGIVLYYTEGYAPAPDIEKVGVDTLGKIPGYDDLTPYGAGVLGKTIGPISSSSPFDSVAFVDTLLSYTTQSRTLEWITNEGTADKYIGYFDSVKYYLQQSDVASALTVLEQVLTDAETDNGSTLTSEAYALIRFNTEYLIERLPEE